MREVEKMYRNFRRSTILNKLTLPGRAKLAIDGGFSFSQPRVAVKIIS